MPEPTEPQELTDDEYDAVFRAGREGATDEAIGNIVRAMFHWSYIIRDPLGKVCAVGRGTRDDCIRIGFELADAHAAEELPSDCVTPEGEVAPELEQQALNEPWRLVLWPPRLDKNPPAWIGWDGDEDDGWDGDEDDGPRLVPA